MKPTAVHIDLGECRKEVQFEIPKDAADSFFDSIAKEMGGKLRVKGFRSGKAPLSIIRGRYQRELEGELVRRELPSMIEGEMKEKAIRLCGEPHLVDVKMDSEGALCIRVRYEVFPVIEPHDYKGIEFRDEPIVVTADDVERELQALRERTADLVPVEGRGVQVGDHAVCDLTSAVGGHEDRKENVLILIDEPSGETPMSTKLLTMAMGDETTIEVPEAGGKTVRYLVKLKGIKTKHIKELDDDFAKDLGEFETLDQLRARIRKDIEALAEERRREAVVDQLRGALLASHVFPLPEQLLDQHVNDSLARMFKRFEESGAMEQIDRINWKELQEQLRERSKVALRWSLLLREIAEKEGIQVSDEEADQEIAKLAAQRKITPEKVRSILSKDNKLDGFKADLRESKVVDFLVKNGTMIGKEPEK